MTADADAEYFDLLKKSLCGWLYDESAFEVIQHLLFNGQPVNLPPDITVVRRRPFDAARREIGKDWPFVGYTMIGMKRLDNIQFCVEQALRDNTPGDLMEAGVWRGGAAMLIKAILKRRGVTDRILWLADSFAGMPSPTPQDFALDPRDHSGDAFLAVSAEQVAANFQRFGLLDDKVRFIKGWFRDSLPSAPIGKLAVLRLDADLYESTRDALTHLCPRVNPGGFIIIDDYGDWVGCRKAVEEYRAAHSISSPMEQIDLNGVFWRVE